MSALIFLLALIWVCSELCLADEAAPEPEDPYRLEKWRDGNETKEN